MATEINYKSVISASLDSVWATIKIFDGVERYLPMVNSSRLEIENDVTRRVCDVQVKSDQKARLVERLDFVDEQKHSVGYTIIEAPEPFKDATVVITVTKSSGNKCEIEFSGKFKGDNNLEVKQMVESIYSMMADGLKKLHES